jgi:hypothetical protein
MPYSHSHSGPVSAYSAFNTLAEKHGLITLQACTIPIIEHANVDGSEVERMVYLLRRS